MSGFLSTLTHFPSLLKGMPCLLCEENRPVLGGAQGWNGYVGFNAETRTVSARTQIYAHRAHWVSRAASGTWPYGLQAMVSRVPKRCRRSGSVGLSEVRERTYLACAGFSSMSILRTWGLLLSQG